MSFDFGDTSKPTSFARKYRPKDLEHYVGNSKIREKVFKRMNNENSPLPQTVLMSGTTGCGKTTLARILMREYMCSERGLVACGECTSCTAMDHYVETGDTDSLPDVHEIDIADSSKKEEIEAEIEDMELTALTGDWKVYLLDEFHMASPSAQNALLKRTEEPPENVLIIIATTDPQKIIATIKNRMNFKLHVERPNTEELVAHLATICEHEDLDYDLEGLRAICNLSDHIIRDALQLLEEVTSVWGGATIEQVQKEFDVLQDTLLFDFIHAYKVRDYVKYSSMLYNIKQKMSLDSFKSNITSFIMRGIYIKSGVPVNGLDSKEIRKYGEFFKKFDERELAVLMANLNKVSVGNIEANFLAFIYDERDYLFQPPAAVEEKKEQIVISNTGQTESEVRDRANSKKEHSLAQLAAGEEHLSGIPGEIVSGIAILEHFPQAKRIIPKVTTEG